jgi:putative oxidoreductase
MIGSSLNRYRDVGLLILRVGIGAAFIAHGWPKLMGGRAAWEGIGSTVHAPAPLVAGLIAALIEFGGGILFAAGALFRVVSLLLFLQMCVALFGYHLPHHDPYPVYSNALQMAVVFLAFIIIGPGRYSVDRDPPASR